MKGIDALSTKNVLLSRIILFICVPIVFSGLVIVALEYPGGTDWFIAYRPAVLALLHGQNPYTASRFLNPPWLLLPLIPFAMLPGKWGFALLFAFGFFTYGYLSYRLKAKPIVTALLLVSYPVGFCLAYGNIDWLIPLGFFLPPQLGLFLLLAKPQCGAGIAIYWLVEAYQKGGFKQVVHTFTPVIIGLLAWLLIYHPWTIPYVDHYSAAFNLSFFPWSLPFAIALLVFAIRTRKPTLAFVASPFLFPYFATQTLSVVLVGLSPYTVTSAVAVIGIWLWRILHGSYMV